VTREKDFGGQNLEPEKKESEEEELELEERF